MSTLQIASCVGLPAGEGTDGSGDAPVLFAAPQFVLPSVAGTAGRRVAAPPAGLSFPSVAGPRKQSRTYALAGGPRPRR
jgi:hypothetical protein